MFFKINNNVEYVVKNRVLHGMQRISLGQLGFSRYNWNHVLFSDTLG